MYAREPKSAKGTVEKASDKLKSNSKARQVKQAVVEEVEYVEVTTFLLEGACLLAY